MNTLFPLRGRLKNAFATVNGLERAERYVPQQEQLPLLARPECQLFSEEEKEGEGDEWTSSF